MPIIEVCVLSVHVNVLANLSIHVDTMVGNVPPSSSLMLGPRLLAFEIGKKRHRSRMFRQSLSATYNLFQKVNLADILYAICTRGSKCNCQNFIFESLNS